MITCHSLKGICLHRLTPGGAHPLCNMDVSPVKRSMTRRRKQRFSMMEHSSVSPVNVMCAAEFQRKGRKQWRKRERIVTKVLDDQRCPMPRFLKIATWLVFIVVGQQLCMGRGLMIQGQFLLQSKDRRITRRYMRGFERLNERRDKS